MLKIKQAFLQSLTLHVLCLHNVYFQEYMGKTSSGYNIINSQPHANLFLHSTFISKVTLNKLLKYSVLHKEKQYLIYEIIMESKYDMVRSINIQTIQIWRQFCFLSPHLLTTHKEWDTILREQVKTFLSLQKGELVSLSRERHQEISPEYD